MLFQLWFILLAPFFGFLMAFALGKKHHQTAAYLSCASTFLALCFSLWLITASSLPLVHFSFNWFSIDSQSFKFGFWLDHTSIVMLCLVNFIAFLVQVYSLVYMHDEADFHRYFGFLSLFTFAKLGIVLADNLLVLYGFWELVGLSSYLLIGFWYQKPQAVQAAKKAFLINRIGDIGLALGIFMVYQKVGNVNFESFNHLAQTPDTLVGLLLFCGCVAKSAQFPLHIWLPDAMEGPTPVSALIHAATMVAAGIFLMVRVSPLLSADAQLVIAITGSITLLLGGFFAVFQTDIKKVLAYSTISQLGLMVLAIGLGANTAAMFHLFTHAFFKAGLFLCAGAVIHSQPHRANHNPQDMLLMGGLRKVLPYTFVCFSICTAALVGLPLFSGYLSKDFILGYVLMNVSSQKTSFWLLGASFLSSALTAFYISRQLFLVFFGRYRNPDTNLNANHEAPWLMRLPLLLLAGLSLGIVFSVNPLSAQNAWFVNWLGLESWQNNTELLHHIHTAGPYSTGLALLGIGLAYWLVVLRQKLVFSFQVPHFLIDTFELLVFRPMLSLSTLLAWIDTNIVDFMVNFLANLQVQIAKTTAWIDQNLIDGLVNGSANFAGWLGSNTRKIQTGQVQLYLVMMVLSIVAFMLYSFW